MLLANFSSFCIVLTLAACATNTSHHPAEVEYAADGAIESSHDAESLFAPEIIARLSADDRQHMAASLQAAIYGDRGKTFKWQDTGSGNSGSAVALRRGYDPESGRICAELRQILIEQARVVTATGYACRRPSGSWALEPGFQGCRELL
jgi:surface antigen